MIDPQEFDEKMGRPTLLRTEEGFSNHNQVMPVSYPLSPSSNKVPRSIDFNRVN